MGCQISPEGRACCLLQHTCRAQLVSMTQAVGLPLQSWAGGAPAAALKSVLGCQ